MVCKGTERLFLISRFVRSGSMRKVNHRSMRGGAKADNSFPVNIQKVVVCFRIIWQGSLIDVYATNHNTTPINHHTGIQIQNARSKF